MSTLPMLYPNEFAIDLVATALQQLITAQLGEEINVDSIGTRDFDEQGDLTITAPAARVLFIDERPSDPVENQNQVYNVSQAFAILCAAEDLSSTEAQRLASLQLAATVKHTLVGARLQLADGSASEPVIFAGTQPLPTRDLGMAYAVQVIVGGIAQFAAPNATAAQQGGN